MDKVRKKKRRPKLSRARLLHVFVRMFDIVYGLDKKGVFDERPDN